MPRPNLAPPPVQVGGYIPFVDFPCERFLGEFIGWIVFLSVTGPVICRKVPWLCCPLPFEFNATNTISSDIRCDEIGAYYGAPMFWAMQGISIWGLLLSFTGLATCTVDNIVGKNTTTQIFPNFVDVRMFINHHVQSAQRFLPQPREWMEQLPTDACFNAIWGVGKQHLYATTLLSYQEGWQQLVRLAVEGKELPTPPGLLREGGNTSAALVRDRRSVASLRIPIPTLIPLYIGPDDQPDACERDEVRHMDGRCYQVMSQGPCEETEFVLLDHSSRKGFCAPRLCNPDRVFVFGDQMCHDPYESNICPPGRTLFTTSFGSPVCGCPYGGYEEDDDLDDDVCRPVLAKLVTCPPGQVFWFRNFKSEPECLSDPCHGLNLKRGQDELPYVPSAFDGRCYQLAEELPQCPSDTFYTLSYTSLSGICASLKEAGYTILDKEMLETFAGLYGPALPTEAKRFDSASKRRPTSKNEAERKTPKALLEIGSHPSLTESDQTWSLGVGNSVETTDSTAIRAPPTENAPPDQNWSLGVGNSAETTDSIAVRAPPDQTWSLGVGNSAETTDSIAVRAPPTENAPPPPVALFQPLRQMLDRSFFEDEEEEFDRRRRRRREILPHGSPETVFQSTLAACRAGSQIGVNFKCNTKYLPNRVPLSRPTRSVAPISPNPSCAQGSLYSLRRECVANRDQVQNGLIANGLG